MAVECGWNVWNLRRFGRGIGLGVSCLVLAACLQAQAPAQTPAVEVKFDGQRAFEHLRQLVAIGPRPAGSKGAVDTRAYITKQLAAVGLTVTEQAFDQVTPAGTVRMVNLSATLPGKGEGRLIIAGHYDTKLFTEFRFVGANDAGSSTAFLLELARAMQGRTNAITIELLFLDGEEAFGEWKTGNTFGSRYYVEAARKAGTIRQIKGLILVDMIAEKSSGGRAMVLRRESNSTPWMVDAIWAAARKLNRPEFVDEATAIEDDHLPFLAAGIPAVDIIDLDYPDWHQEGDTLDKVSAESLQVVGDVLLAALPVIELRVR